MKKPLFTSFLGIALVGALLSSSAFAAGKIDYAAFKALKIAPLVTNAVPDAPVPADIQADFNKCRSEACNFIDHGKDYAKGIPAFEAALKKFAAYPGLVRQLRGDYAWRLIQDWNHRKDAIAVYELLISEKGRPTRDVTQWLREERSIYQQFKLYAELNDTLLRLLAQPDIKDDERFNIKRTIVDNLGYKMKDYEAAYALAAGLARDPSLTPAQRANMAFMAGSFANNYLQDQDKIIPLYREIIRIDGVPDSDCHQMLGHICNRLINKQTPETTAEAFELARSFYTDAKRDLPSRVHCLNDASNRRFWLRQDDNKMIYVKEIEDFIAKNAKELKPDQIASLNYRLYDIYNRHDSKSEKASVLAEQVFADTNAAVWQRIGCARFLGDAFRNKGQNAKAADIYLKALPIAKNDPNQIGNLINELAWIKGCENDLDGALAVVRKAYQYNKSPNMTNLVIEATATVYRNFNEYDQAYELFTKEGKRYDAAQIARDAWRYSAPEKARKLFMDLVADEKQPEDIRRRSYDQVYGMAHDDATKAFCDKYFDFYATGDANRTNGVLGMLANRARRTTGWPYYGDYDTVIWNWEKYEKLADAAKKPYDFMLVQYSAFAYAYRGRFDRAAEICKHALAQENSNAKPIEAYELGLIADILPRKGSVKDLTKAVAEADKRLAKDLPVKDRVDRIERVGSLANIGDREDLVRALDAYKDSLYVPQDKKRYIVEYSEKPLLGIAGWDQLAKKPVAQKMDRSYGGNMDFLVTDVATGNRGEGIAAGKAKDDAERPTIAIVCDSQGIHFRFEVQDERARDIENGILGAGSYEGYIAPGPNQPYVCILLDVRSGKLDLYNTTYDTTGHRRIKNDDPSAFRTQTYFTDTSIVTYLMLSWENYATLIPSDGTVWDFENVLWGRKGNAAWNGTESIHGRSTWGELEFRIPEKARAQILKRVLFQAMNQYNAEKRCSHSYEGVIDHWQDSAVGDPAFYEACVKPLVEKLDAYLPLMKEDMSDADVVRVANEALAGWRDIRYTISRLRQEYLAKALTTDPAE